MAGVGDPRKRLSMKSILILVGLLKLCTLSKPAFLSLFPIKTVLHYYIRVVFIQFQANQQSSNSQQVPIGQWEFRLPLTSADQRSQDPGCAV